MLEKPGGLPVILLKNPQRLPGIRGLDLQPEIRAASPPAGVGGVSGKQRRDTLFCKQYLQRFEVSQFAGTKGNTLILHSDIHGATVASPILLAQVFTSFCPGDQRDVAGGASTDTGSILVTTAGAVMHLRVDCASFSLAAPGGCGLLRPSK